jgi:hypothetical protein
MPRRHAAETLLSSSNQLQGFFRQGGRAGVAVPTGLAGPDAQGTTLMPRPEGSCRHHRTDLGQTHLCLPACDLGGVTLLGWRLLFSSTKRPWLCLNLVRWQAEDKPWWRRVQVSTSCSLYSVGGMVASWLLSLELDYVCDIQASLTVVKRSLWHHAFVRLCM